MSLRKAFRAFWIGGLVVFAIVVAISLPLGISAVPGGILDHQAAGTAARVNEIQAAWAAAGLTGTARIAMFGDMIFIGIYGLGSLLGGWYYYRTGHGAVRAIGLVVIVCAAVFLITDYAETTAQLVQLLRDRGGDRLAGFAAALGPVKSLAFFGTVIGVIAAFALRRIQRPKA